MRSKKKTDKTLILKYHSQFNSKNNRLTSLTKAYAGSKISCLFLIKFIYTTSKIAELISSTIIFTEKLQM